MKKEMWKGKKIERGRNKRGKKIKEERGRRRRKDERNEEGSKTEKT
jgi:hypothetical protein